MKDLLPKILLFVLFAFPQSSVFAEVRVTPFGVFDPDEAMKISYNVETEDGVETKSRIVPAGSVSGKKQLEALLKRLGSVSFVLSPKDTDVIESQSSFEIMMKPDPRASKASFRTRTYNRVKTLIITETRKYYKESIPNAVLPNGQFINAGGGSMVLVDKNMRPLGTLIISYSTEFVTPAPQELENSDFSVFSQIPVLWESAGYAPNNWSVYKLPSGEKVCVKRVEKLYRVVGFKARATVTFTFNKLK